MNKLIKINDESAIVKRVTVQERKDGVKFVVLPQFFGENGLDLSGGDEIELCMDKANKIVFFRYGKEKMPGDAGQSAPDGAGVQE